MCMITDEAHGGQQKRVYIPVSCPAVRCFVTVESVHLKIPCRNT